MKKILFLSSFLMIFLLAACENNSIKEKVNVTTSAGKENYSISDENRKNNSVDINSTDAQEALRLVEELLR